jgi:YegS/Rv2252/BmrU family lipid kinase
VPADRSAPRVVVIVNPISGTGGRASVARRRVTMAREAVGNRRVDGTVRVTESAGHARALAREALAAGADLVVAWGGDGTLNEVGSELAFRNVTLAVVPSGSGNGLARELGIPFAPTRALDVAFDGRDRQIDAGEIDGRLFFNIAGLGLDARVAHEFAAHGLVRRGFRRYLAIAIREASGFEPDDHTIVVDGVAARHRALIVAVANGRQYGNGARIAPHARLDDGQLDVVVVAHRPLWEALLEAPLLFAGRVDRARGVTVRRGAQVEITTGRPAIYHADGEPFVGGASILARIRPGALRIRVPRDVT